MPTTDQISTQQIAKMRRAFEDAIADIRSATTLRVIEDAIQAGDIDRLIALLGLDETTFAPLSEAMRDSYMTGGQYAAQILSPIPSDVGAVVFRFDMTATAAAQWIATESSRMVVEIAESQRQMIRERIAEGTAAGINPRQQALDLVGRVGTDGVRRGGFIGLTQQQAQWIANARAELQTGNSNYFTRALRDKRFDATFRRLFDDGKKPTQQQINAAITSMQNRAQKYRADTIARTEAINGLRAGQAEGVAQAIRKGDIDPGDVTKIWDSTGDGRTRLTHLQMEDQRRALYQPFDFPFGGQAMYPGDDSLGAPTNEIIQCRCRVIYRVDYLGRAIRMQGFR